MRVVRQARSGLNGWAFTTGSNCPPFSNMHEISEPEARILLDRPLRCEDVGDWKAVGIGLNTCLLQSGLICQNRMATELYVELKFCRRAGPGRISYSFSVFRRNRCNVDRVYQLTVVQSPKPIKDKHGQSHEHIGASRTLGTAEWQEWSYDDVLKHFCARTNITFVPTPGHPENFRRNG